MENALTPLRTERLISFDVEWLPSAKKSISVRQCYSLLQFTMYSTIVLVHLDTGAPYFGHPRADYEIYRVVCVQRKWRGTDTHFVTAQDFINARTSLKMLVGFLFWLSSTNIE